MRLASTASIATPTPTPRPDPRRPRRRATCNRCERCEREPDRHCRACAARMHHAVRLVTRDGLSVAEAASRLQLSEPRVERLLEQHTDRELVTAYVLDEVGNGSLRHIFAEARRADPELTTAELARRVGSTQVQVERWLGLRETAPKTDADGRTYAPRKIERISVDVAGRLARAIGCAPCEVDGC